MMPIEGCPDYATKEELQELRDQLNEALGETEEGGKISLFEQGKDSNLIKGGLALTLLGLTKTRAANAIVDLAIDNPAFEPIYRDFAKGNAKWAKVKATGQRIPLPNLTKQATVAGQGVAGSATVAKVGVAAGGGVLLLANLVQIAGTLALNKATVDILDERIDAEARGAQLQIDAVNNSMLRLYDKNNQDVQQVIQQLDQNEAIAEQNRIGIEAARVDIFDAQRVNSDLIGQINDAQNSISRLEAQNQDLVAEINDSNIETQEILDDLTAQSTSLVTQIEAANLLVTQLQETITTQDARITELETKTEELEDRILATSLQYVHLREEFIKLDQELSGEIDLVNDQVSLIEGKIAKTQKFVKTNRGGSSGLAAATGAAAGQTALLELTSQLTGTDVDTPEITTTDLFNNTSTFDDTFNDLLTQIQTGGSVTPQQIEDLRTGITTGVSSDLTSLLSTSFVPKLDTITKQTTERRMINATKSGICESLNGQGSCPVTPENPNPTQGLKGMQDALKNTLNGVSDKLGLANLAANSTIVGIVTNTNQAVRSTKYGLEKIQDFSEVAWKVTRADKIMAGVNTALTVHNAMMLSNNVTQTISEATNMAFNALGIRDETDAPIDFGASIKSKITGLLTNLLGAEQYTALTARIAKSNRIYQASINMLDTTRALFDSARSVAELTAENTGKIGNALRESAVVYEDAYEEFAEKVNPQNVAMRRLDRFREGADTIEDVFSTISQVSGEVVEIQDNWGQLKTEKENWKEEVKTTTDTQIAEKTEAKEAVQVTTDITDNDFERNETITDTTT